MYRGGLGGGRERDAKGVRRLAALSFHCLRAGEPTPSSPAHPVAQSRRLGMSHLGHQNFCFLPVTNPALFYFSAYAAPVPTILSLSLSLSCTCAGPVREKDERGRERGEGGRGAVREIKKTRGACRCAVTYLTGLVVLDGDH